MAVVAIKHAKVVSIPDDPNYPVGSNEWNENHLVTGLENVDNTSDANKPVSTAQAAAIAVVQSDITAHEANMANPHAVTKAQVGLGNVDNTSDASKPVSTAQAAADAAVAAAAANASNLTSGTVAIARGGTGQATAAAGFDALAPTTTRGDIIYRNATTNARLGAGTVGYHLQTNGAGADPSWEGFLPAGTGAVTRTWQDKARESVSVLDFGAKNDLSVNCKDAFVAAWEAAKAAGFGTVKIPAGRYLVEGGTAALLGGTGITLSGDSSGGTIIVNGNTNLPAIQVGSLSDPLAFANAVENLSFGGKAGVTGVAGQYGLVVNKQGHARLKNLKAANFPSALHKGLLFDTISQGQVGDWIAQNCILNGIEVNNSLDLSGTSFRSDANGGAGWVFTECQGLYLHGGSGFSNGSNAIQFVGAGIGNFNCFLTSWVGDTSGSDNWLITNLRDSTLSQCWGSTQKSAAVNTGASGFFLSSSNVRNVTFNQPTAFNNNGNGIQLFDNGTTGSPTNIKLVVPTLGVVSNPNGQGGVVGGRYGLWLNGTADVTVLGGQALGNVDGAYSNTSSGNFIVRDLTGVTNSSTWQTETAPVFKATSPPATAWGLDCTGVNLAVANTATVDFAAGSGLIVVTDTSVTGSSAVYLVSGGSPVLVSQTGTLFVAGVAAAASGKVGIAFNGTSAYRINNQQGNAITFNIAMIRTRTTA